MYLPTRKNNILEVPNWYLMMIFKVVVICDRGDFVFEIVICDIIHLTQNKKPVLLENRPWFGGKREIYSY
jgi:hypothetical protein